MKNWAKHVIITDSTASSHSLFVYLLVLPFFLWNRILAGRPSTACQPDGLEWRCLRLRYPTERPTLFVVLWFDTLCQSDGPNEWLPYSSGPRSLLFTTLLFVYFYTELLWHGQRGTINNVDEWILVVFCRCAWNHVRAKRLWQWHSPKL